MRGGGGFGGKVGVKVMDELVLSTGVKLLELILVGLAISGLDCGRKVDCVK